MAYADFMNKMVLLTTDWRRFELCLKEDLSLRGSQEEIESAFNVSNSGDAKKHDQISFYLDKIGQVHGITGHPLLFQF